MLKSLDEIERGFVILKRDISEAEEMLPEIEKVSSEYRNGKCKVIEMIDSCCSSGGRIDLTLCEEHIQMILRINSCLERVQNLHEHFLDNLRWVIQPSPVLDRIVFEIQEFNRRTKSLVEQNMAMADTMQAVIDYYDQDDCLEDDDHLIPNAFKILLDTYTFDAVSLHDVSEFEKFISELKNAVQNAERIAEEPYMVMYYAINMPPEYFIK